MRCFLKKLRSYSRILRDRRSQRSRQISTLGFPDVDNYVPSMVDGGLPFQFTLSQIFCTAAQLDTSMQYGFLQKGFHPKMEDSQFNRDANGLDI